MDVCTLDGKQRTVDILEAPSGVARALVPEGNMERQLDIKMAASSPSINAPADDRGAFRVGGESERGGRGDPFSLLADKDVVEDDCLLVGEEIVHDVERGSLGE